MRTISERVGVSTSTVSRALNGHSRISTKTRASVLAVALEQGYTPNAMARSLVTRRSRVVGLVIGEVDNPFYPELLTRLHFHLSARELRPMLLHIGSGPMEKETAQTLLQYQLDGCLIASATLHSRVEETCRRYGVPVIMINRVAQIHSCGVSCNNLAGGRLAAEFMVDAGHRRIALIAGRAKTSISEDRAAGFVAALAERELTLAARKEGGSTYLGGFAAARDLIASSVQLDAVFAVNDIMAMGVIDAMREVGLRVPQDVSVMGFDDIQAASWPLYDLTTVAQPVDAMIRRALDLLVDRIEDPARVGEDVFIHGELRRRRSVRLP
jgi:DNA-binding LacI/PurR family transcriptional regulator